MDKEFEEWLDQLEGFHLVRENFTLEQIQMIEVGWNASKQYWLDKVVEVANRKLRGITPECNGYNRCSTETVEAIKGLKG